MGAIGRRILSGKYQRGDLPGEGRLSTTPNQDEEAWDRRSTDRNWRIIDAVGQIAEDRGESYSQVAIN